MLLYWGRRGAMARFSLELLRAAGERGDDAFDFCVSRSNELIDQYRETPAHLFEVDTFRSGLGALTEAWRIPGLRRALRRRIAEQRIDWVVNLMPHVWTPLTVDAVRRDGCRFATLIHDARPHPGDASGIVLRWCNSEAARADRVLVLSEAVRAELTARRPGLAARTRVLFHPDMAVGSKPGGRRSDGDVFRVLFFGRILPYKGLPLLVEALEMLQAKGLGFELTVLGSGEVGALRPRLDRLGARTVLGWFKEEDLAAALAQTDAVALSHVEASQSGVASVAAAAGVPAVVTPVGALREQVRDGIEGVVADAVTPAAFAAALERLARSPALAEAIRDNLATGRESRSMAAFLDRLKGALGGAKRDDFGRLPR